MEVKYILPKKLRKRLAKPFGKVFKEPNAAKNVDLYLRENRTPMLIAVGDVTAHKLISHGRFPHLSIIDGKTKRGNYAVNWGWFGVTKHRWINPAAGITEDVMMKLSLLISLINSHKPPLRMNRDIVFIDGEEDLLVLPCVKFAPIGSIIVYGQPDIGIVLIEVDDAVKLKVKGILKEMESW